MYCADRMPLFRAIATAIALSLAGCAGTGGSSTGGSTAKADSAEFQLHNQAVAAVRAGDPARAEQLFAELARQYPDYATPWLNVALLRYKRGDANGAGDAATEALKRDSGLAPAWNLQGVLAREVNDIDAAENAYRQALTVNSSYAPAWLNLGILLEIWRGQLAAALDAYEKYVEFSPESERDPRVAGWIADLQRRLDRGA